VSSSDRFKLKGDNIIEVAGEIFRTRGYEATSIQEIADAVGLLKGSLYHYFSSKEEILYEVVKSVHVDGPALIARSDARTGPPEQRLREFLWDSVHYNAEHVTKAAVFYRDGHHLTGRRRQAIVDLRDRYQETLEQLLHACRGADLIPPEADTKLLTLAALGLVNSLHVWYRPDGPWTPDAIADGFVEVLLGGQPGSGRLPKPPKEGTTS
jgi:AcrR family transcriptional regulator